MDKLFGNRLGHEAASTKDAEKAEHVEISADEVKGPGQ
jgi:hypothetical protein